MAYHFKVQKILELFLPFSQGFCSVGFPHFYKCLGFICFLHFFQMPVLFIVPIFTKVFLLFFVVPMFTMVKFTSLQNIYCPDSCSDFTHESRLYFKYLINVYIELSVYASFVFANLNLCDLRFRHFCFICSSVTQISYL